MWKTLILVTSKVIIFKLQTLIVKKNSESEKKMLIRCTVWKRLSKNSIHICIKKWNRTFYYTWKENYEQIRQNNAI